MLQMRVVTMPWSQSRS